MKSTCGIFLVNKYNELLVTHPTHAPEFHSWSIPKGEPDEHDADLLRTAIRECFEETGLLLSTDNVFYLGSNDYKSGMKRIYGFLIKDDSIGREIVICNSTYTTADGVVTPENDKYLWLSVVNEFERDFLIKLLHESQIKYVDEILKIIGKI